MTDTGVLATSDYEPKFIENFTGGINLEGRANAIEDNELLVAEGVRFEEEKVLLDYGYTKFAQPVIGRPRATFQFFRKDGTSQLVLITNSRVYIYDGAVDKWHFVEDGVNTVLSNNEVTTDTVMEVPSTIGFIVGRPVAVELDNGDQHQTTIASINPGVSVTLNVGLPSNAAAGNALFQSTLLNGSDDIPISLDVWAASDKLYFTNGVDTPKQFDSVVCNDIPNLPGTTFKCRVIIVHDLYLHLMHTEEDGTIFPQRVRNSDTGNPENWTTGNAGFADLYEGESFIQDAERVGVYLIIYKERAIIRQEFVGQDDLLFDRETTINGEGLLNASTVINLGDTHIFPGNSNFYEYSGTFDLDALGDKIRKRIYSQSGEASPAKFDKSFSFYVEELDEMWFFYVNSGQTDPMKFLRYNVSDQSWASRTTAEFMAGYGFFQSTGDRTWSTTPGTWAEQTVSWNSRQLLNASPTILLCGIDNQVYEYDFISGSDDGVPISYEVVTKDFYIPGAFLRTSWFEFNARGTGISFEFSTDNGKTWVVLGVVSPGIEFDTVRIDRDIVAKQIRFRWKGAGGNFALEWLMIMWRPESLW